MSRCNRLLARWGCLLLPLLLAFPSCTKFLTVAPQGVVIPTTDEDFAAIVHTLVNDVEGGGDPYLLGNMETLVTREGCADDLDAVRKTIGLFRAESFLVRIEGESNGVLRVSTVSPSGLKGRLKEEFRVKDDKNGRLVLEPIRVEKTVPVPAQI